MKRLTTATIVCATLLGGGMCSLCAETGEGASAGERNVWTLSGGVLSKGDWKFPANWDATKKFLNVTGYTAGSGVLDWDGFVLSMGSQEISDLNVVVRGSAFANNAPITEFRCDKAIFNPYAFNNNKSLLSVRAGGLYRTTLPEYCFADCTSLTNVVFDFPNMTGEVGKYVFYNCTSLSADVMDILNPAVTSVEHSAFYNVAGLTGELTLTNIQTLGGSAFKQTGLTKLYLAGPLESIPDSAFYNDSCAGITNATFDLAENATVHEWAFRGGTGSPFERIRFLRKPFGASVTNMLGYVKKLTDPKACQIRVSRNQWSMEERQASGWWRPATKEGGLSDEELAAKPKGCLGYTEATFSGWPINGAVRRAWIVHEPSPHDKGGFCVIIR